MTSTGFLIMTGFLILALVSLYIGLLATSKDVDT